MKYYGQLYFYNDETESYFDMLIDFLEFINNYNIPNEK